MIRTSHRQSQKGFTRQTVGAGFFSVLNQPLLAGREFDERDQLVDLDLTADAPDTSASGAESKSCPRPFRR